MKKDKKFKNVPLCVEKKVSGKLFHASPKGVKRMEALNKLANNGVLDFIFRLDWHIFNSLMRIILDAYRFAAYVKKHSRCFFLNCPESTKGL